MAKTEKKFYLFTLLLGMTSLLICALCITMILKDNQYLMIDPTQDMYQLEVLDSQKGILQIAAMIPTLIFILNLLMTVLVYRHKENRSQKSFTMALGWIVTSMVYQIMMYMTTANGISLDLILLPAMAATWILKLLTFWFVIKELRQEKRAQKGALCVN